MHESDFQRIARVIAFVDENFRRQPGLEEMAAISGLSESHFSRLFKRWAGLTPGRYLQQLTVEQAKRNLDDSHSVLDTALDSGLSGPGRLHDLFVRIEAMSPGEYKAGAANLDLSYGTTVSPFGDVYLVRSPRGICELRFLGERSSRQMLNASRARWPQARFQPGDVSRDVERIFSGSAEHVLHVAGTNFQLQVWRALLSIPVAQTANYGSIAHQVGRPKAARAVGTAIGSNPVAWLIPCHRVLQKNGSLGGYRWGTERKAAMLRWERLQQAS